MTNILVLHHTMDGASAELLARALTATGFTAPELIEAADLVSHPAEVRAALDACAAAIVLWSESSSRCARFAGLAGAAWESGKQFSVRGPNAGAPAEFSRPAPFELAEWRGDLTHSGFKRLTGLLAVRRGVERAFEPEPEPAEPTSAVTVHSVRLPAIDVALAKLGAPAVVAPRVRAQQPQPRKAAVRRSGWDRGRSAANVMAGAMVGFAGALFASPLADSSNPGAGRDFEPLARTHEAAPGADAALTSHETSTAAIPRALSEMLELSSAQGVTTLVLNTPTVPRAFFLDGPDRFVVDIPNANWPRQGRGEGAGVARAYRYANRPDGSARLVLDLTGPTRLNSAFVEEEGSFVFELSDLSAAAPERDARLDAPFGRFDAPLIVVDAGHGGRDVGVVGVDGVLEKDLALAAALRLRDALTARGYEVALTRADDTFLSLDRRVAFARGRNAALMISLHADSEPTSLASGASVYTLAPNYSVTQDGRENVGGAFTALDAVLHHARGETASRSTAFSRRVLDKLEQSGAPLLQNALKNAHFVVLQAPDVPTVLVEMGFVTQAEDIARLENPVAQARFIHALAEAVDEHFAEPANFATADACDASAVCLGAARFTF